MDREISRSERRAASGRRILPMLGFVILLGAVIWLVRKQLAPRLESKDLRFSVVKRGPLVSTISASGVVLPASDQVLTAPIEGLIKKVNLRAGADVRPGDVIIELEKEFTILERDQLRDQLEVRKNNVTKLNLEFQKNVRDLELEDQIKGLQVESLEAELEDKRKLQQLGGATAEEVERAQLELKIAQLEKQQLENDLNFRQKTLVSDQRNLELEVQIQEKRLKELNRKLYQSDVRAPREGVLTWVNENLGSRMSVGEPVVRMADLASYRIEGRVSDMHLEKIMEGMPVKVRINRNELEGYISKIYPEIESNTIKFDIQLLDPADLNLRLNMVVEVFIVTDQKEDVLYSIKGPAFRGTQQDIFVVKDRIAQKRRLRLGMSNIDFIELAGEITEGDTVIISDMESFKHLDNFTLQ